MANATDIIRRVETRLHSSLGEMIRSAGNQFTGQFEVSVVVHMGQGGVGSVVVEVCKEKVRETVKR